MSIVLVVLGKHFDCDSAVYGGNMTSDDDDAAGAGDDIFQISTLKYIKLFTSIILFKL